MESLNLLRYFEPDGNVKPEALSENAWLRYLTASENYYWNAERIEKMSDRKKNTVLDYVIRTLDILDSVQDLPDDDYHLIRTVLCWSEIAKTGSEKDRKRWIKREYPLDIHNEASAMIYADHYPVRSFCDDTILILIRTHGLAGQFIRGECTMESSKDLHILAEHMNKDRFCRIVTVLNECIIRAVSEKIWEQVQERIIRFSEDLYENRIQEPDPGDRLNALLPSSGSAEENTIGFFSEKVFPYFDLWYFQSALEPFGFENAAKICRLAVDFCYENPEIRHLNFKPLADAMYYDYEGKKHVNTYKQRILERWLSDQDEYGQHVRLSFEKNRISVLVGVSFTPVCQKLIDFCVEAERSGLLSYEKSITMLYDTFGFRRDSFDRLNNEEKYLETMNSAQESTKLSILDHITGNTIVDVGSGGGVLLDELEKRYPDRIIIGTDISQNVIEVLEQRKRDLKRHWSARIHNFVESPLDIKADSIVFSSIIHEIYSYTDLGNGRFDPLSIEKALGNAVLSLNPGGRIIIRDGIKTPGNGKIRIHFKSGNGMDFFKQFLKDFHGLDSLSEDRKVYSIDMKNQTVVTDINYGREFLYTYTWGPESFSHEVQECFGYYQLTDFEKFFSQHGMKILKAESFLEPGYEEHLLPVVDLFDPDSPEGTRKMRLPDSNCIIVAEKPLQD